jgi:hypothetical protein
MRKIHPASRTTPCLFPGTAGHPVVIGDFPGKSGRGQVCLGAVIGAQSRQKQVKCYGSQSIGIIYSKLLNPGHRATIIVSPDATNFMMKKSLKLAIPGAWAAEAPMFLPYKQTDTGTNNNRPMTGHPTACLSHVECA